MAGDGRGVRGAAVGRLHRRQPERRAGLGHVLASLIAAIARADAPLRGIFEEGTRRLVHAQQLRLHDGPPQPTSARGPAQALALPVPVPDPRHPLVLEAVSQPHRRFDDWDVQLLQLASQLAALVVEIERGQRLAPPALASGPPRDGAAPFIGSTSLMRALRQKIERVAASDFTVLVEGESGSGKELVARQLHDLSRRRDGPFVAINCAALVETLVEAELFGIEERTATGVRGRRGKFEHADGGTLFLDEVSDLSPAAQAKLLRAIQDLAVERVGGHGLHQVNTRIVAATNRSLRQLVHEKLFRPDLYYRLGGVEIHVPPLRARRADVLELAEYFLDRHRGERAWQLSPAVKDALITYAWPGNVRELQRVVEGVVALGRGDLVELDDLPPTVRGDYEQVLLPSLERHESMRAWGSRYARLVLERCDHNKRRACEMLDISYHTLQAYLRHPGAARAADAAWPRATERTAGGGHGTIES
jgi:transcriptional regulator with PAS, ATPase and Fis domain